MAQTDPNNIINTGQDDITNQSSKWNPQGNRKVGRP